MYPCPFYAVQTLKNLNTRAEKKYRDKCNVHAYPMVGHSKRLNNKILIFYSVTISFMDTLGCVPIFRQT